MSNLSLLFSKLTPFRLGLIAIFLISFILRFWHLSQFNSLVFDEVYYAKFANEYLIGKPFFQSHPPLSQYLIAFSIWLGSLFPASPDSVNVLTGSLRSTFSYRWLNAFSGSFIPLIFGGIAYELSKRRSYTLIAAFFVAMDGLFLVESRYALNNIYLVGFGLLGHYFFLRIFRGRLSKLNLIYSGIFLGLSAAIKWNGLAFLLSIYLLILMVVISGNLNLWARLKQIGSFWLILSLGIMPIITYSLLWIPHLMINPEYNFWEVHREILSFHQRIGGNTSTVHPYCSPWYTWPVLWRPIAYYYETQKITEKGEVIGRVIYDVHALGNPLLWWFSTIAILTLFGLFIWQLLPKSNLALFPYNKTVAMYFLIGYITNLLPWLKISRCTFLYHYMGSYSFAILALAWIIDHWLISPIENEKNLAIATIVLITLAFIYWLPIYLGMPILDSGFQLRMLLPSWV